MEVTVNLTDQATEDLTTLRSGGVVAVVTLLGSLSPITLAHVKAFVEARRLLLAVKGESDAQWRPEGLEHFDYVLGFISLNPDDYVLRKLERNGEDQKQFLDFDQRVTLAKLAISDLPWMNVEEMEGVTMKSLREKFPNLSFYRFTMNGADDVVLYKKWKWAGKPAKKRGGTSVVVDKDSGRYITMGRQGDTELLIAAMEKHGIKANPSFIVGPELPDISSTKARKALAERNLDQLREMLHPLVIDWCLQQGPWTNT